MDDKADWRICLSLYNWLASIIGEDKKVLT